MDAGIDRKVVKGKAGAHIHFYSSHYPKVISFHVNQISEPITYEDLCIKVFKNEVFQYTEKAFPFMERDPSKILPGSMHLFQLWDCDTRHYRPPNHILHPEEIRERGREFILRIRFKYDPDLVHMGFADVCEMGDFYYFFAQCRHDFIHDVMHNIYHSNIKEDLSVGLAIADMTRIAFEKEITLKQLKSKHAYTDYLPRHVMKRTRNLLVKMKLGKSIESVLDETYWNFHTSGTNPYKTSIVSYLKQLLLTVPDYGSEEFHIVNHPSNCSKILVHPFREKVCGILLCSHKGHLEQIGDLNDLRAVDLRGVNVLMHFENAKAEHLEFADMDSAASFVALLDGYYRLRYDYHYCLSNQIYSPIVKLWNNMKSYGPLSVQAPHHHVGHSDSVHKDYLKGIWKRNAAVVGEGTFLIKQRSTSFNDFVIIIHKMGRIYPAIPILYNEETKRYACDDEAMRQLVQPTNGLLSFSSVRDLVKYYRDGNCMLFKLATQLSPIPREEVPMMVCRERSSSKPNRDSQSMSSSSGNLTLECTRTDRPLLIQRHDINFKSRIHESRHFDLIEGTFNKSISPIRDTVLIKQVKDSAPNRPMLTLFFQRDVQKCCCWNHDCIAKVLGVSLSPFFVVSQRVAEGRLDHFLRRHPDSFQVAHCVQATGQLAQVLTYMESNGFTHGNIRSKCLLVSEFDSHGSIAVKLAADMMNSYYSSLSLNDRHNAERLPWLAPERWNNLELETSESDVYSFGMTVWEIFSQGARPFTSLSTLEELKIFIESGKVMPVPTSIAVLDPASSGSGEQAKQFETLMDIIYKKVILSNINADPSGRMKPQDTVKEIILLSGLVNPKRAYDPVAFVSSNSASSVSVSSAASQNGHSLTPLQSRSHNGASRRSSMSNRPLPSIPCQSLPIQPHVISQANIIDLESRDTRKLGQGFYGEVYLCKLRLTGRNQPIKCAVKKLIDKNYDDEAFEAHLREFERELKMMVLLEHKNIVKMYGECFYTYSDGQESRLIVMEYIKCGSLSRFVVEAEKLRPLDERIQLYKKFALDIAEGMLFLHSLDDAIIHRDLAARNVLITEEPHTAKITDFGLARMLTEKDYYRCDQKSILPFLWCAPESLTMRKFTKASDVWSYAVVLWEMYSPGQRPYVSSVKTKPREDGSLEIDIQSLIETLGSSGPNTRLSKPQAISTDMYNMMMRCWNTDPSKRPTFEHIKTELENQIPSWQ